MHGKAALAIGLCLLFSCLGIAQTGGTISGNVSDSTGALIPGASVTIKNVDTGLTRELLSDEQGRYSAPNLPVGPYEVQISLPGFRTEIRRGVQLTVGQQAVINVTLQVGEISEQIEVTEEAAAAVETTNATVSSLVSQDTIRDMPLNGRSFTDLIPLQVGTVLARNNTTTSALGGGAKISVTGARPLTNNFLLDGTDIVDPRGAIPGGATGGSLGVETVREFRVLTNGYSAEYGRASGGVFTAITRSGTNELHGSLFEFLRNSALDASRWADNTFGREKPPFKRNQFGGTVGGPIVKNKTFFFGGYEGLRDRLGTTEISYVPNALARQGIIPRGGAVGAPLDCPYQTISTSPLTCAIAPGVKPWLDLYPLPNGVDLGNGTGEYISGKSQPTNEDYYTVKVDQTFSSKQSIFGRYTYDNSEVLAPGALPFLSTPSTSMQRYLTIQEDSVFSATTLNTVRFGLVQSQPLETTDVNIPKEMTFVPGQPFSGNGGQLSVSGLPGIGDYLNPRGQKYTNIEFSDDLTLVRGAHSIKAGAIFKRLMSLQIAVSAGGGRYTINGGLNDMLAGRSNSLLFQWPTTTSNRDWRQNLVGAYIQDDYKIRPNLTLNLGLREEFVTSPIEIEGRCANMPSVYLNETIVGCPLFKSLKNNWAPRVGFAWDSMNNARLVVRGGFGLFYDMPLPTYWQVAGRGVTPHVYLSTLTNAPFPNAAFGIDFSQPPTTIKVGLRGFDYTDTPYVMQYNLNIQSQLSNNTALTLGYLGSQSRHLIVSQQQNVNQWVILPDGRKCYPSNTPGTPCPGTNAGLLNPTWINTSIATTSGNANYNALVASVNQTVTSGLRVQAGYTFGKTMSEADTVFGADFSSDASGGTTDPYDRKLDRGLAGYHLKHSFNLNYSYDFPFRGSGVMGKLISGWQMSGIIKSQSGIPFSVTTARVPGDGLVVGAFGGSPSYRPDLKPGSSNNPISGVSIGCGSIAAGTPLGTPDLYFDPCVFENPAFGVYGTAGRHTVIGPRYNSLDFSLLKSTPVREGQTLQFRAEFFNILNHANFSNPAAGIFDSRGNRTATAGRITDTVGTARQIQFGLKYVF
jgi:hypothetical protein